MDEPFCQGNILCICTGSYVRSHIAATILRRVMSAYGDDLTIETAGTTDWGVGREINPLVRSIIGEHTEFHPHEVMLDEVRWANIILVMEFAHERHFLNHFRMFAYKVLLLSELLGERVSLPNPHYEDGEGIGEITRIIERYIVGGYPALRGRLTPTLGADRWRLRLAP